MRKPTALPGPDPSRSGTEPSRSDATHGRDAESPPERTPGDPAAPAHEHELAAPSANSPSQAAETTAVETNQAEGHPNTLVWPPPEDELAGWEIIQLEATGKTLIEPMRQRSEAPSRPELASRREPAVRADVSAWPDRPARPDLSARVDSPTPVMPPPAAPRLGPVLAPPSGSAPPAPTRPAGPPVLSDPDENLPETQVIEPLLGESLIGPRSMDRRPTVVTRSPAASGPTPTVVVPGTLGSQSLTGREQTQPRLVAQPTAPATSGARPPVVPVVPPADPDDTVDPAAQTRIIPIPAFVKSRSAAPTDDPLKDLSTARTIDAYLDETRIITRPPVPRAPAGPTPAGPTPIEAAWAQAGSPSTTPAGRATPHSDELTLQTLTAQSPLGAATQPAETAPGRKMPAWWIALIIIAMLAIAEMAYLLVRTLQPAAATALTGTLVVESAPVGAEVYVDGSLVGRTPFRIELAPGEHALEVRSGELRRTRPVTLQAGALVSHMVELASAPVPPAAPPPAAIEVRSEPAGARVSIGGVERGRTPLVVSGLEPGRHQVKVSGPFKAVFRQVTIAAGQHALIVVTPARSEDRDRSDADDPPATADREELSSPTTPVAGRGWITIDSPLVLRIVRNGDFLGTSEDNRIQLPAGVHDISLENESVNFRETRKVEVPVNRGVSVSVTLPQGTLSINAQPWAEVFVDNQRIGETPVSQLLLPIGAHEVLFRHPQFGERRVTVVVKVGTPGRTFADFTK